MENLKLYAQQSSHLWLAGFKEACCFHRVVRLCISSRMLSIRTGQCFLLNGFIYLGSLLMLKSVVIPILLWILPSQCEHLHGSGGAMALYSILRYILTELFYIFWFYPLYVFSIVLSSIWYNDIAKQAFDAVKRLGLNSTQGPNEIDSSMDSHLGRPGGFEGVMLGLGEQVYSILLLTIFFIEVFLTGFIPYIGKAINFLLLSWMYAYYCFEYKWNLSELNLDKRLDFFETNWAFFLGFGSPCVLAIFFFSPLVNYGVMAILFPLFVLTAAATQAEQVIECKKIMGRKRARKAPDILCCQYSIDAGVRMLPQVSERTMTKSNRCWLRTIGFKGAWFCNSFPRPRKSNNQWKESLLRFLFYRGNWGQGPLPCIYSFQDCKFSLYNQYVHNLQVKYMYI